MAGIPGPYTIELSFNNFAESFRIPVNPETIEFSQSGQGKTYDIVGKGGSAAETRAGEIQVIQNPKLQEISFNSLFPAVHSPFAVVSPDQLRKPLAYINLIQAWMASLRPIRFIYNGANVYISIPASIEKFQWKEAAGSPGDIEYSLSLKEYVFYAPRKAVVVKDESGMDVLVPEPPERPDERKRPSTYIVQPGDDLVKIAMKFYNLDSSRAADIQRINQLTDAQTRPLETGLELELPES
ncbi:peptidoglycan-binding protein [Paenibacillus hodogayensis]|uniref:Peptidoglycan-binding protein n=1 Tax=Paenibacillus hodogayensis TaxID=279208 RepID=A0ABV5W0W4_9BACL